MKKASTSRLKKLPILLGTLLIISVAAYGTRAYFSDSTNQQANIELKLGNVEITTKESTWKVTSNGTESTSSIVTKDDQKYTSFTNVKPGDSFTRKYTIENTGSLDAIVGLNYSGKFAAKDVIANSVNNSNTEYDFVVKDTEGPFLISVKGISKDFQLEPKQSEEYDVTITIDPDASNKLYNKKNNNIDTVVSNFLNETITVTANQKK